MVRTFFQEDLMRVSRQDLADLLVEAARQYRLKGVFTLRRQSREFYFRLGRNLVLVARGILDGAVELIGGPQPDVCINPRCVHFAADGLPCPHEARERICEVEASRRDSS
jgi:hypothetical protein